MIGNSKHSVRLISWRTLRWAIALPALPLVWWACTSHPLTQPIPDPQQETYIYVPVSPTRLLDLVFMVDNSPSMAPKQAKLKDQFPLLINALKDPNNNNQLPDLHVAIIDSDLGTGNAWTSGACGTTYGDQGKFRMINSVNGSTPCGVTSPDALWLEYTKNKPVNFTGDIGQVFGCLAMNLGTLGCGEEHQLQAFEFALVAGGLGNEPQHAMLRGPAYLGLVFLTDEDDCSAQTNTGMFGDKTELSAESASLRCYSRSHECKIGNDLVNLTTAPPGPGYPTTAAFTAPLSSCQARTDSCPNYTDQGPGNATDTSVATDCSPLKNIHHLAEELKSLKEDPDNQLLVAGIFGWPANNADMATAQYKIDKTPNPNPGDKIHTTLWDSWPVCYDPSHRPSAQTTDATTGFDSTAAGWGATAGLRNSAFIDEFGKNGLKFSICEADFTNSMKAIGDAIFKKLQNLCVPAQLWLNTSGAPDCRVAYRTPTPNVKDPTKTDWTEDPKGLPMCDPGTTADNVQSDCWMLVFDPGKCPDAYKGQWISVLRKKQDLTDNPLPAGTTLQMQCRTCTDFIDSNGHPLTGC